MYNSYLILFVCVCVPWATLAQTPPDPCQDVNRIQWDLDANPFVRSKVILIPDFGYDSLTIQPSTGVNKINYGSHILFATNTSGTYTVFANKGQCFMNTSIDIKIANVTITQPKCYGGPIKLVVTGLENNNVGYRVDKPQYFYTNDSFVYEDVPINTPIASLRIFLDGSSWRTRFVYDISKMLMPKLSIVHPVCRQANGRVSITNAAQFTSLTLEINGANITGDGTGVFNSLKSFDGNKVPFVLYAKAAQCGSQTIRFPGMLTPPTPIVSASSQSLQTCNKTYSLTTLSIAGGVPLADGMNVDGQPADTGIQMTLRQSAVNIDFVSMSCITSRTVDLVSKYMPVTHSIGKNAALPHCSTNATATVTYPGNYASLTIDQGSALDANHQLQVRDGDTIMASTSCEVGSMSFSYPVLNPIFQVTTTDPSCIGEYTLSVLNYVMYDSLFITNVDTPSNTVNAVDGVMKGLYTGNWIVTVVEKNCGGVIPSPKNAIFTIMSPAKCLQSYAEVMINYTLTINAIFVNGTNIYRASGEVYQLPVGTTYFRIITSIPSNAYSCVQDEWITIESQTTTVLGVNVTPQKSSDCLHPSATMSFTSPWSDFNSASANMDYPFVDGVATLGSYPSVSVVFDHKTCGKGIIQNVPVPTDDNVTISVVPFYTSGCLNPANTASNSAILNMTIGGQRIPSQDIIVMGPGYHRNTGFLYGMPTGITNMYLGYNACYWTYNFTQKFDPRPSYRVDIIQMPTTAEPNGIAEVVTLRDDVVIQSVSPSNGYSADNRYIVGWDHTDSFQVAIEDFWGCAYMFTLNVSDPMPQPRYTLTPPTACGSSVFKMQFDKASIDKFEITVLDQSPDANGVVYADYKQDPYILYRPLLEFVRNPTNFEYHTMNIAGIPEGPTSLPNMAINYSITGETCAYARDGSIVVTGADTANFQYKLYNPETGMQADTFIAGNTITFQYLTADTYQLTVFSRANTYCAQMINVVVPSSEPKVTIVAPRICDASLNHSSITFNVSPASLLSATTFMLNTKTVGAVANNLEVGAYTAEAIISAGICSRHFVFPVQIINSFYEATLNSIQCGQLLFMATSTNNVEFTPRLLNSKGVEVISVQTYNIDNTNVIYQGLYTGTYKVASTDESGCVYTTPLVQVTACPTQAPSTTSTTAASTTSTTTTTSPSTTDGSTTTSTTSTTGPTTTTTTGTTTGLNSSSQTSVSTTLLLVLLIITISTFLI
ncbi:hypothetical protein SAMD00019534_004960 [Acytostelium subglobosum LB1]|uniref:hypothetical protein n=1 Tax=Acytostelium subglobosum LB1 TaxID=1410327 RepID=UPI000644BC18|nr:hypothetical protein SAMD00019534_004960 [Acytostelium subglobosum LB1]GAM17321.1 hypothetical protein SAMD00019534_004960 [Acytostelium subglobosum LB1]|eukprot:XP_012759383.1 hypothetical protein SAMD00019534_004960 [Acytostelium subglobosum LB1]